MLASRLARIELTNPDDLRWIDQAGGIIDQVRGHAAEVYLLPEDFASLQDQGFRLEWIADLKTEYLQNLWAVTGGSDNPLADYHTNNEIEAQFISWQSSYPNLFHYESIGNSVQGRPLWVAKLSDNVSTDEAEIEVKYVSTMHGNEFVGTENCINFMSECLTLYGSDAELTELMNDYEMWFLPLMNPDGHNAGIRYNANGVDLNRDFPDRIDDSVNTTTGRAIEVAHVMNWSAAHNFVLSANFHTGTIVVNYPWDNNATHQSIDSPTPEDVLFEHLSRRYSTYNSPMYNSNEFPPYGITNGADWYAISGGMQDWNYTWMGDKDVTIELTYDIPPDTSQLPQLWLDNRLSMRYYWLEAKYGIRGIVTDSLSGLPLRANVRLGTNPYLTYSSALHGDYYRILQNGTYTLTFSAPGYVSKTVSNVVVAGGVPTVLNVQLNTAPSATISVVPDSVFAGIDVCDSVDQSITIQNSGQIALNWSAVEDLITTPHYGSATGGGYRWLDSDAPDGPTYNWASLTNRGTAISFTGDDQNLGPYAIGFSFPYYGTNYTTVRVSANGWLSFTSTANGTSSYDNIYLPNGSAPENLIGPWWDDLSPQRAGSRVRYYSNNADSFIVSFESVQSYQNNGLYNFEVILLSDGKITFQYAGMGVNRLNSATIGFQNSDRTRGLTASYNALYIRDNMAISVCPRSMVELLPASGTVPAGNSVVVTMRLRSCCLPDGLSSGNLRITSNDPVRPTVLVPVTIDAGAVPPVAVNNLVIGLSGVEVLLMWSPAAGATSYNIYRSDTFPVDPLPQNLIGSTAATNYLDPTPGAQRFYCVTAVN